MKLASKLNETPRYGVKKTSTPHVLVEAARFSRPLLATSSAANERATLQLAERRIKRGRNPGGNLNTRGKFSVPST